jgi:hypothetical protein
MKTIKKPLFYYGLGIALSLLCIGFIHLFRYISEIYFCYAECDNVLVTALISGLPFGALLWIGYTINSLPRTKNIYLIAVLKAFTYYWIGFIAGLIILGFSQLYIFVFNEPYYYATLESIIAFALLLAIPLAILVHIIKTLIDESNIKSIEQ